jgi:hypothetical protein
LIAEVKAEPFTAAACDTGMLNMPKNKAIKVARKILFIGPRPTI